MGVDRRMRAYRDATAIVTGGASGIGRALAEELARRGSDVVLVDRHIEQAEEVAGSIGASGGKATAMEVDVADYSAMDRVVQETVNRTGRVDYLFNNAGIGIGGTVEQYAIEDWNYILDVNLRGVINGVQAVYKVMIAQGYGHIINTASMAGLMPSPGMVSYGTTKYAVVGLSTSLRTEAAQFGIRVSVFCPGFVRTAILDRGGRYGRVLHDWSPEQQKRLMKELDKINPMDPNAFARKALDAVAKNKAIIILPGKWKVFWLIHRLFPNVGLFLARKHFEEMRKVFNPQGKS